MNAFCSHFICFLIQRCQSFISKSDSSISSFRIRNHYSAIHTDGMYAAVNEWKNDRPSQKRHLQQQQHEQMFQEEVAAEFNYTLSEQHGDDAFVSKLFQKVKKIPTKSSG